MNEARVTGIVDVVEETKSYGKNNFQKRLVVLKQEGERFTNYIPLEFVQQRCEMADSLRIGDEVEVTYRLNGRKWQRDPSSEVKYFLSAEVVSFNMMNSSGGGGSDMGDLPPELDGSVQGNPEDGGDFDMF